MSPILFMERVKEYFLYRHVDGDFFTHFLDSPEQSLLIIPLYSKIMPGGSGTIICPAGISLIAQHLYDHPEGVTPRMVPIGETSTDKDLKWFTKLVQQFPREEFHEMTGDIGDVVIMHQLMLHSASRNTLRIPRVITNPAMGMREPFRHPRENIEDYSLIEMKTIAALGESIEEGRLKGWQITGKRSLLKPTREKIQEGMKEQEQRRLRGELLNGNMEKGYDINRLEGETV